MEYQSGAAFRRALEDRLRTRSIDSGTPLVRLRKMVAFERLLARLFKDQPDGWVLKGGLALQLRLGDRARTTKDVDLLHTVGREDARRALARAAALDLGDWFHFEVTQPADEPPDGQAGGLRFPVHALLDGRTFEAFHVDVGQGDPLVDQPDLLAISNLLDFAGIPETVVPCYPVTQQIAEKVHAYTRPRASGEPSRLKDFVDILLLAGLGQISGQALAEALSATFEAADTHPLPHVLPDPPRAWAGPLRTMARDLDVGYADLAEATGAAKRFLDPVFGRHAGGTWDSIGWTWRG